MRQVSKIHIWIATGFGSGFSPIAPGTAGALLATALWGIASLLFPFGAVQFGTLAGIVLFTVLGIVSATAVEKIWGEDPSKVVIDEMVGVWIPLLAVPDNTYKYGYALAAFVLFRLLDIFKPLGIRKMENFKGGVGIMMDDILAGIYSFIVLIGVRCIAG